MSKKKQTSFFCGNCGRDDFKSRAGLNCHKTRVHPYVPPPPPEKVFKSHVALVKGAKWGRELTKYEREHPPSELLQLGYLAYACELLEWILHELRRERIIK